MQSYTSPQKSAGLVVIAENKILLCHPTNTKWVNTFTIPKGHIEEGETPEDAAIRETLEEVGLSVKKKQMEDGGVIEYRDKSGLLFKTVYYFLVKLPKIDEEIISRYKLQEEEINWAGFLNKKEADKKIFWRFKPFLNYLT